MSAWVVTCRRLSSATLCGLVFLLTSCSGLWTGQPPVAAERPNIVLIIADDLNWDDSTPYGHPSIHTPHLQILSDQGLRFDAAFLTSSSCSPSRASLITGRYPHSTDAEQLHWPLPAEQVTFVEKLRESGYWCGAAGKWHLGPHAKTRFDRVIEADPSGFQLGGARGDASGAMTASKNASGCEDWIPLMRERPLNQPFFLWLAALDPHRDYEPGAFTPAHTPDQVRVPLHLPDVPEVRKDLAMYYDEIARLDRYIGLVMEELARQGVAEHTLVLFMSDNGRPFPRDKTTLYDGGIRTPLIARWPGRIPAGSVSRTLVSSVDLAPTLLQAAGLPLSPTFQGRSFLHLFKEPAAAHRKYVFAEAHWHDFENHARAVRGDRYKLIRNDYPDLPATPPADALRSPTWRAMQNLRADHLLSPAQEACFRAPRASEELYDLHTDPFELQNLAGLPESQPVLEELRAALAAWTKETGDSIPPARTPDEFDRVTGQPLPNRIRPRPDKAQMRGNAP